MSHVRTLNLLNNQAILPQAEKQAGEGQAIKEQFTRVLEHLRIEANRSGQRTSSSRRADGRGVDEPSGRVERDRSGKVERDRSEPRQESAGAAEVEAGRLEGRDRSQPERDTSRALEPESDRGRVAESADQEPARLAEPDRPVAEPTDAAEASAPPDAGQTQGTDGANPPPADVPPDQAQPAGQETNPQVGQQSTGGQGQAGAPVVTSAQQAALLLAQLGQGAVGQTQGEVSGSPGQTTIPADGSSAPPAPQIGASLPTGPVVQQTAPTNGEAAAAQTSEPVAPGALQPRPVSPTGGQGGVEAQTPRSETPEPSPGRIGQPDQARTSPDGARSRTGPDGAQSGADRDGAPSNADRDRPQSGTSDQAAYHSAKGGRGQPTRASTASRVASVGPELAQGEAKAKPAETSDATDTAADPNRPNRPVNGHVTRMWTGPARGGPVASVSQGAKADQQNQALAAEATRQIARFVIRPGEQAESSATERGAPPGQPVGPSAGGMTPGQPAGPTLAEPALAPAPPVAPSLELGAHSEPTGRGATTGLSEMTRGVPAQENIDRIVRVLRAHVGSRESQIRIQLEPPELGRIRIDVRIRDDALFMNVETETAAGRDLINSRLAQLREALQQHGIIMARANVQMRDAVPDTPQAREQQGQPSQQSNQNSSQEAPGQTAEQSQDPDGRDGSARGDDVPAPSSSSGADGSGDADGSADAADAGGETGSGGGPSSSTTESWVDLVA